MCFTSLSSFLFSLFRLRLLPPFILAFVCHRRRVWSMFYDNRKEFMCRMALRANIDSSQQKLRENMLVRREKADMWVEGLGSVDSAFWLSAHIKYSITMLTQIFLFVWSAHFASFISFFYILIHWSVEDASNWIMKRCNLQRTRRFIKKTHLDVHGDDEVRNVCLSSSSSWSLAETDCFRDKKHKQMSAEGRSSFGSR